MSELKLSRSNSFSEVDRKSIESSSMEEHFDIPVMTKPGKIPGQRPPKLVLESLPSRKHPV